MKKFFIKAFSLCVIILSILFSFDVWISHVLGDSKSFSMGDATIWNEIINNEIDADLLIYGSSRAWVHFDPIFIEDNTGVASYNFGVDGQSFDIQNLRHELFLKYNKKMKYIIYSVDINTLNKSKGLYNDDQFLPFLMSENLIRKWTKKYINFSCIDYNVPLLRYKGRTKALKYFAKHTLKIQFPKIRTRGFASQNKKWNKDYEIARKNRKSYHVKINMNTVIEFDAFLQNTKKDSIKVIMMYAPEHIFGQSFVKNRSEVIQIFDSLARKNNIPFYNYSTNIMNQDKEFFYNSLHLNSAGVKKFNELYIEDLKMNMDNSIK